MSESGKNQDTSHQASQGRLWSEGQFLERVAYRLDNGLSEAELAEEVLAEALRLSQSSLGYVARFSSQSRELELQAVARLQANGTLDQELGDLIQHRPDRVLRDVIATNKPLYVNDGAQHPVTNLPEHHPDIHCYLICPLRERSTLKGLLLLANAPHGYNTSMLGRIQATADAIVRIHVNSVVNRGINRMVAAIGDVNQHWSKLVDACFDSVVTINSDAHIMSVNAAGEQLFQASAKDLVGSHIERLLPGDVINLIAGDPADTTIRSTRHERPVYEINRVMASKPAGTRFPVNIAFFHGVEAGKRLTTLIVRSCPDATVGSVRAGLDPLVTLDKLSGLLPFGVLQLNNAWLCEYANSHWCEFTGTDTSQNLESGWLDAFHEDDKPHLLIHMRYAMLKQSTFRETLRVKRAEGGYIKADICATSVGENIPGYTGGVIVVVNGLSAARHGEAMTELTHHDALTSLPDRSQFLEHLKIALSRSSANAVPRVALLFIDLDGFKAVNDTLGHNAGDELLQQVALRLTHTVPDTGIVARLGGDEFSIILPGVDERDEASAIADTIVQTIKRPFILEKDEVYVSASIGIALNRGTSEDPGADANNLIKQADVALYRAKLSGRSRHVFFTAELDQAQRERSVLITSLRRAVDRQDFELFYQPQLLIREQQLLGFEALLRWPQALGDYISPSDFIEVLEDTGLIGELGEWAIGQACSQHRIWRDRGLIGPAATMSVNVSARQLGMPNFTESVARILHNQKMRPDSLILEITESALVQTFESNIIKDIKNLGVQISLDDFGTGYSSLAYLSQLPLDHLKIDRSFIADIVRFPHAVTVIKSIIALANTLGIRVIAEGVEDGSVLPLLADEGCEGYQGFYFSQPLPADRMTSKLQDLDSVKLSHYANFINLDASMAF